jgi:hypothetical protein
MALTLFEQQLHNIEIQIRGFRKRDAIGRRAASCRFPYAQCWSLAYWNDLSHGRVTVQHGNGFTGPNCPQVLAESRFELGDAHLLHVSHYDHKWSHLQWAAKLRSPAKPASDP